MEVTELKNTITKLKINLGKFHNRLDEAERMTSKLIDGTQELIHTEQREKNENK